MRVICISLKNLLIKSGLIALVLAIVFGMQSAAVYAVKTASARALPIYSVERTDMKISITFDCAWGTEYTDEILTCMAENGVQCTFFAVQFWVEKNADYVQKIFDAGHEIGTHSKTHAYMSKQSESEIKEELCSSASAIEKITKQKVTLFRAPYGDYNNRLINTASSLNLYTIQWDVDSLDWKNLSESEIAERVINGVQPGSIILCHNNGLNTAKALPTIFKTLKERGYEFVPVGQLIHLNGYTIDASGRQRKNAA